LTRKVVGHDRTAFWGGEIRWEKGNLKKVQATGGGKTEKKSKKINEKKNQKGREGREKRGRTLSERGQNLEGEKGQ